MPAILGPIIGITLGLSLLYLAGAGVERCLRSASSARTAWQVILSAAALLCFAEATGYGDRLLLWAQHAWNRTETSAASTPVVDVPQTARVDEASESPARCHIAAAQEDTAVIVPQARWTPPIPELEATAPTATISAWEPEIAPHFEPEASPSEPPVVFDDTPVAASQAVAAGAPSTQQERVFPWSLVVQAALFVWVWGMLALVVCAAWKHLRVARLIGKARVETNEPLQAAVDVLAAKLGLRCKVRILRIPGLATPVAFGFRRLWLGLPDEFPAAHLRLRDRAVLLHELAHLAGGDAWWNVLADGLVAAVWWHPAAWLIRKHWRFAAETAADEAAALLPGGAEALAEGLVRYGKRMQRRALAWQGADGEGFRSSLGRRVARLLRLSREKGARAITFRVSPQRRASRLVVSGMCVVAVLFGTAWARPGSIEVSSFQGDAQMTKIGWRQSLTAAALAAFLLPVAGQTASADPPKPDGLPAETAVAAEHDEAEHEEHAREHEEKEEHQEHAVREREEGEHEHAVREHEEENDEEGEVRERREGRESDRPDRPHPEARERDVPRDAPPEARERAVQALREEVRRQMEELERHQMELRRHAEEVERMIHEHEDQPEAVEEGRRELGNIERMMHEIEQRKAELRRRVEEAMRQMAGPPRDVPRPGAELLERLERRMNELREAIARAREEGREDLLERLRDQAEETERALARAREEMRGDRPDPPRPPQVYRPEPRPPVPPQVAERIERLMQAARLLRESGHPDMAEAIEREARMLREGANRPDVRPPQPAPIRRPTDRPPERIRPPVERPAPEAREGEIEALRAHIRELEEALKRVTERLEQIER
ncbi:hypothetical protein JCM19992_04020 [Thermostilla marina]